MVYLPHWPIPSTLGNRAINYETVFERASIILEKLGNPHKKLPPVIHVAGTNGKGSSSALIAKIFECSGYKAHLYTSPHLHECNERIVLDGQKIDDGNLYQAMEEVRLVSQGVDLTFMEGFTIGAFVAFSRIPADVLVVECGMGGRIDITNIIEEKLACVITSISMDHKEYLGENLPQIALQKAHIMRRNTPVIIAPQALEVKQLLQIIAQDLGALSYFYDDDFYVEKTPDDALTAAGSFDFYWQKEPLLANLAKPHLLGDHQYYNCANAIACCMAISDKFTFTHKSINQAISTVKWPNRLEKIENNLTKIFQNKLTEIWIDGAHNEGGAYVLANWIASQTNMKNFVICGFSRAKCKIEFLEKFRNIAELVAVRVNGEPYPESAEKICEIGESGGLEIVNGSDLLEALEIIALKVGNAPARVVICGSLHLARDVEYFHRNVFLKNHN